MDPDAVGRVSRDWDEHRLDLHGAAAQVAHAPTSGFTPDVARAAADFVRAWTSHLDRAAELSAEQADALREVLGAWLSADQLSAERALAVLGYLEERR